MTTAQDQEVVAVLGLVEHVAGDNERGALILHVSKHCLQLASTIVFSEWGQVRPSVQKRMGTSGPPMSAMPGLTRECCPPLRLCTMVWICPVNQGFR